MPKMTHTVCSAILLLAHAAPAAEMVSLNGDWDFTYTASSAAEVPELPPPAAFDVKARVPGCWDDQLDRFEKATWWPKASFRTTIAPVRYLSGVGWYWRSIDAPADWRGRAARLTIGWAVSEIHVWLNHEHVGSYDYGVYTPYSVDVTPHLRPGQTNELVISVDNTRGFTGGWAYLGNAGKASGITRPVTLEVAAGPGRIEDVYIRPGASLEEVVWQVDLSAMARAPESKLRWQVLSAGQQDILKEGTVSVPEFTRGHSLTWRARVDGIKPWSDRRPNLYWTRLRWVMAHGKPWDERRQRFGLRRWTYEGRKLKLNGRPIYLRGEFGAYYFPVHCSTPTSKDYWLWHIKRAKQIGMNYLNFAARVCPTELLEAADELGMVVQCGDHMTVLKQHRDCYREVWEPIVRWTRQHPSMCFYGFGGERNYYEGIIEQYQKQHDLIKSLHPECMVMPQQAIRGIDYSFDEKGSKELTPKPFPHHAQRLARYTKACDLFGHYSGGAFGYTYFHTPWREMEQRFTVYTRPLVSHELFMAASYLDPDNAAKYTGRVPPYLYTKLNDDLTEAGLLDRWRTYHLNSSRLQGLCKKYCVEKTRKCDGLAGYEYLGMTDQHFTPHYTTGILDEFLQLKPGDTVEGILRYNGESVLLLDFPGEFPGRCTAGSINRCYWAGDRFAATAMVSLYGERPLTKGKLAWALRRGDEIVQDGDAQVVDAANGRVTEIHSIEIGWPSVKRTTKLNLEVRLTGSGHDLRNDWDFWVFPRLPVTRVAATTDETSGKLLGDRCERVKESAAKLWVVSRIGVREIGHLTNGGDVLLLGTKPFTTHAAWRTFRPGLGARLHHNVGTVIAQHPIFKHLPHEGWGDWHFCPLIEGAPCIMFDADLQTEFDPILEIVSSAGSVRKQAAIFEKRVGSGRLMVSTCFLDRSNPACVALMDSILSYVQSDGFRPATKLDGSTLKELCAPRPPRDPRNSIQCSSFERASDVVSHWAPYGGQYEIDRATAHRGRKSLKITITEEDRKKDRGCYTGACASGLRLRGSPKAIRVSTWHKTATVPPTDSARFLIFVYLTYRDGERFTLRLFFDASPHDWRYAEKVWEPPKPIRSAILYIGMMHVTGTAWFDDVYFGEASSRPLLGTAAGEEWHREAVALELPSVRWYRVNDGGWQRGRKVEVAREGVNKVSTREAEAGEPDDAREVRIDLTPPVIRLIARPVLDQQGGVYFGSADTTFSVEVADGLSGVKLTELSIDGGEHLPYRKPFRLPAGAHQLRARATDRAGNQSDLLTGDCLTGGETRSLKVLVK